MRTCQFLNARTIIKEYFQTNNIINFQNVKKFIENRPTDGIILDRYVAMIISIMKGNTNDEDAMWR
jgi:hypothetical protein